MRDAGDGKSVTRKRDCDMGRDHMEALEQEKQLGVSTILTSGQADTCVHGWELLDRLQKQAGTALTILAGGGIHTEAVRFLLSRTCLKAFHMSGKTVLESGMRYRNPNVSMGLAGFSEYEIWRTDPAAVRACRSLLPSTYSAGSHTPDSSFPSSTSIT